jgi:hypothetical protein
MGSRHSLSMDQKNAKESHVESRRTFLKQAALAGGAVVGGSLFPFTSHGAGMDAVAGAAAPWHRRALRWGQTNITEPDPQRYDIDWWRQHWKRTQVQGVIINAGGIVAYYPSKVPFHKQAEFLDGRDLFGELCGAAQKEGLAVFARMDSNRAHQELYRAQPGWFALDAAGRPYKAGDLFVTCINGPYYDEHIPAIMREIVERYNPEGFTDNSWSGLGRANICYCNNCQKKFQALTGHSIPRDKNWNSPVYRQWIEWNYARRLEIWDANNEVTRAVGGPDCIWVGMNSGSISSQGQSFRNYKEICARAEMIMLDHQARSDATGFQQNGEIGKLIHGLLGWDKLIPESMAMYQAGRPTFRLSSKPEPEARMWMIEGIAGGLQPWWHHVGAYHEDRRMYRTAEPLYRWHTLNQEFLVNRRPIASVGVVWSQQNSDFFGRDDAELLVDLPWRGVTQALIRARIPYLPVHADHIERDASLFSALILPNLAAMSDDQAASVRRFVQRGGGLLATGESSLLDQWGDSRPDFALADIFGAHIQEQSITGDEAKRKKHASETAHSYLRLSPERRALVDGPKTGFEPAVTTERHAVLQGFDETDILPFGGALEPLRLDESAQVLMTFVPSFPIYPPETAWMREPQTDLPGLILNQVPGAGRVVFLPADLDRRFGRDHLPDHGQLLENLVRWAARGDIPLAVQGAGLIDCHLYQQPGRLILHMVNLTSTGAWRQPMHELIPVGPLRGRVKLPADVRGKRARLLVSGGNASISISKGWCIFEVRSILEHEVVVIG